MGTKAAKRATKKPAKPFDVDVFFDDWDWVEMESAIEMLEPVEDLLSKMRQLGLLSEDIYPDESLKDVLALTRVLVKEGLRRTEEGA